MPETVRDSMHGTLWCRTMAPATHLLLSWLVANVTPGCSAPERRRERFAITAAGLMPDVDGWGLVAGLMTGSLDRGREWFVEYHHLLHNGLMAGGVALVAGLWCRSVIVFVACLVTFHLHLFCDVIGAKGPDGYAWPIPYGLPFSHQWEWVWQGQWALNAWPNTLITAIALVASMWLAHRRGYWFMDLFNRHYDRRVLELLRIHRRDKVA